MANKTQWSNLTAGQQTVIRVVASVELALTATALVQLSRLPHDEVRGRKSLWALGCMVQPVGPVAFLLWGRRRAS